MKSPPFSPSVRLEAGELLRRVQQDEKLGMPYLRSIPGIGSRCHERRIPDVQATQRILYRVDIDTVVILAGCGKTQFVLKVHCNLANGDSVRAARRMLKMAVQ